MTGKYAPEKQDNYGRTFSELYHMHDFIETGGFAQVYTVSKRTEGRLQKHKYRKWWPEFLKPTKAQKATTEEKEEDTKCGDKSTSTKKVVAKILKQKYVTYMTTANHGDVPQEVYFMDVLQTMPAVVDLIEWHDDRSTSFVVIVQELCPGQDIYNYITCKRRPGSNYGDDGAGTFLDEKESASIVRQLTDVLWHMDKIGICHGDIKNENMIWDVERDRLKIVDLGHTHYFDNPLEDVTAATEMFKPPEKIKGQGCTNQGVCAWAIGIVLYELLHGEIPFLTTDMIVSRTPCIHRTRYSPDYIDLTEACLDKDPNTRISLDNILDHPFLN